MLTREDDEEKELIVVSNTKEITIKWVREEEVVIIKEERYIIDRKRGSLDSTQETLNKS